MAYNEIPKQNPFSLYDFIGYFIPGAVFLFLLLLFDKLGDNVCNICNFVEKLAMACSQSFLHSLTSLTFFFALSYILGHIISILSNIIIEKSSLCSHHNYLYFIFLKEKNKEEVPEKGNYFFNFLLFYIFLYELIYKIFDDDPRHQKKLDEVRVAIFQEAVPKIFKEKYKMFEEKDGDYFFILNKDRNFFDCLYHYAVEKGSNNLYKMQNYVALYGFMRNMCMVFCILFWITAVFTVLHFFGVIKIIEYSGVNYLTLFLYSFFGFITMFGLNKYKKRFTLEVLHSTSVLSQEK